MTDTTANCPACGARATVRGRLSEGRPGTFTPEGLRFWTLTRTMLPLLDRHDPGASPLSGSARACTGCGLVWTHVDPARLRDVVEKAGTDEARARLAGGDSSSKR